MNELQRSDHLLCPESPSKAPLYRFFAENSAELTYIDWLCEELWLGHNCLRFLNRELRKNPALIITPEFVRLGVQQESFKAVVEEKWSLGTLQSFLVALMTINRGLSKTGRRADRYGTFFMLAVSEHLRQACGKPHHLRAFSLLMTETGGSRRSRHDERKSANVRISVLKKQLPNWRDIVAETSCRFFVESCGRDRFRRLIEHRGEPLHQGYIDESWLLSSADVLKHSLRSQSTFGIFHPIFQLIENSYSWRLTTSTHTRCRTTGLDGL